MKSQPKSLIDIRYTVSQVNPEWNIASEEKKIGNMDVVLGIDEKTKDEIRQKIIDAMKNWDNFEWDWKKTEIEKFEAVKISENRSVVIDGRGFENTDIQTELDKLPDNIKELKIKKIDASKIDLSRFSELEYLDCSNNVLESLDVSNNLKLEDLYCKENNISEIVWLGNLEKLTFFDCSNNKEIENLDLGKNKNLQFLDVRWLSIKELNVSENVKLKRIICKDNSSLKTLDLSNQNELLKFGVTADQDLEIIF